MPPAPTLTTWLPGLGLYVVPPGETLCAVTVYTPGSRPMRVAVAVTSSAYPFGPATWIAAAAPAGKPATFTVRLPSARP